MRKRTKNETQQTSGATLNNKLRSGRNRRPSGEARPVVTERSVAAFFEQWGKGSWRVHRDDQGRVFRILGGEIENIGRSPQEMGEFIQSLAPELGIPAEQVEIPPFQDRTRNLNIFDSQQIYQGVPVYQAWLRVLANRQSGVGFLFNNNLKPVDPNVDMTIALDLREAEVRLRRYLAGELMDVYASEGPMVWADRPPHQLIYVFHVDLRTDTEKIVLSAGSGEILHRESTRFH
ncbi:MAG: hypothetical protein KDD43_11795 [Bdellovibrionales bacterium]|nr:hypothetical protein [Bdellovibrionales bacterium]